MWHEGDEVSGGAMGETMLSPAAAADYIAQKWGRRWSPRTIRRWAEVGHVAAVRTPTGYRIPVSELERIHTIVNPEAMTTNDNG
jgi:hypothetical protein